jgi:hypothetical protein
MARHSWKDVRPWEVEGFMSSDLLTDSSYVGVRRCLKCGARAWYFGAAGPPHGGCPVKMQTKQPKRVDIAAALRDFDFDPDANLPQK